MKIAIVLLLVCFSLITDQILTAREAMIQSCIDANMAMTPEELNNICGD